MGMLTDFAYIKLLLIWMGLPILAICVILGIIALRIYRKNKINLTFSKRKSIKILLNIIGVLLMAGIFILLLACINAFMDKSDAYNLEFTNKFAYYIILISPILPFLFMFTFVVNLFKTLKSREKTIKIDKDEKFDINSIEKFNVEENKKEEEIEIL